MATTTILVTGRNGQLGSELHHLSIRYPEYTFLFTDLAELDIADAPACKSYFDEHNPTVCINAAAYTAVDKAESDQELALKVNAQGAMNLAENCARLGARLLHVSTDYVFNGGATTPYHEDDQTDPVNFYGYSKLRGEELVLSRNPLTAVIRTSWVYSVFGNNFVKTMLRLMYQRDRLNVVADQSGTPTYAADLAEALLLMAANDGFHPGIFHFSNKGETNWYEFATTIRDMAQLTCEINPITTDQYPTAARRPSYSVMDKSKIQSVYSVALKDWKVSLNKCMTLLGAEAAS